ncbi:hypothetical protein Glove_219g116 [Diversispora epigaea]|uniref:Uncharacterized protein n=1 Tax=Diversispora epigaea TaxID=1348612 RepID=A0A397IJ22_9GLOM|nr:hypothetical protein Glove_219g116 [Diversispora epigaea]
MSLINFYFLSRLLDKNPSSNLKKPSFLRLLTKSLILIKQILKYVHRKNQRKIKSLKASELSSSTLIARESSQAFENEKFKSTSINFIKEKENLKSEWESKLLVLQCRPKQLEASNVKLTSQNKKSEAAVQLIAQKKVHANSTVKLYAQVKKLKASNAELTDQMKKIKTSNSVLAACKKDLKVFNAELDSKIKKKIEDLNARLVADKEKLEAKCSEMATRKGELETQYGKIDLGECPTEHEELKRDLDVEKIKNLEQERNEFTRILKMAEICTECNQESGSDVIEWIHYDRFQDIKQIAKDRKLKKQQRKRRGQHAVVLKKFDNIVDLNEDFLNELKQ